MASNNFINECKKRANGNRLGKIIVDGVTTPITNSDNLKSFSIDEGCYIDGNIIGAVYIKKLTGEFIALPNGINLIDKLIEAQVGVKYADNSTEYVKMGNYIVERPNNEQTANECQITAYDKLINNIDNKYMCNIDYTTSKTLSDLYVDVCNQLDLTPVTTTFLNSTIPITNNPFTNGEKNRLVLQTIAKIACSYITIDNTTNKIDLSWLSQSDEPDYTFFKSDYATLDGGQVTCGPINEVIIKNSQIDDENVTEKNQASIDINGEHSIVISEDYILYNSQLRQQAMTAIFNRLDGLKYVDTSLIIYYGKPFLKIGAKIRIYTSETDYIDTYVLNHNFVYDGTFYSKISSPVLTNQEVKTKQDISLGQALKNTQVTINKQTQEIKSEIINISTNLNNNYATTNELSAIITQTVSEIDSKITESGGFNEITNSPFFQNAKDWDRDENTRFELITGTDEADSTDCKAINILKDKWLAKSFTQDVGKNYTLAFKYRKAAVNSRVSAVYLKQGDVWKTYFTTNQAKDTLTTFSISYEATVPQTTVKIETDNDDFVISDFVIQKGPSSQWSQNALETIGLGHRLDKSELELYDAGTSGERATLDYNDLQFFDDTTRRSRYGKNDMDVPNATISKAKIAGLSFINIDDDNVLIN